ncbi:MAG: hypothetical protein O6848_10430 [Bacteroidetes bacterium]|nr:hypothetical protein [Bacteroidota bacterium]
MKNKLVLTLLLVVSTGMALAQPGWNWPEDKGTAQEKNALYTDYLREGPTQDFMAAIDPHNWLLENAPDLNASLYINGVKIYKGLAKEATDPTKKKEYQEIALKMYDDRIKYFGQEGKVLNRKAYDAYKFHKDQKDKYEELFQLYDRTFELNGNNVGINNLVAYMDVMRRYKLTGGNLTDEDVLERYDLIMQIIDAKIKTGKNVKSLQKNKEFVDKLLTSVVTVDCEFIENKLGPKLEEDPSNLALAKKIMGLSLANKCSSSDSFIKAALVIQEQEPTFGIAKVIALKAGAAGDFATSDKYFNQAIELADENTKKGEVYYALAASYARRKNKPQARSNALKAVSADPSQKVAYKLVGDLYLNSFAECKKGVSRVEDRAVYLAAYDMYKKAGNRKMMNAAEAQFPSIEEIFELDFQEGQTIKVGCWINETVTIQRRPS